jgi:hypothetical protein
MTRRRSVINNVYMKKYSYLLVFSSVLLFFFLFSQSSKAWPGCCSHHNGVCGCGCCDGSPLSATCAPHYPGCSGSSAPAPKIIPVPTPTPVPNPTTPPVIPTAINYDNQIKNKINSVQQDYAGHNQGFRESLIQDIVGIVGSGADINKIGYFVYTILPDIASSDCHVINGLPDLACSPGATDSRVTQDNIKQTICVSGYTSTVRPSSSITNKIKVERMQAYGFTDSMGNYELDHLISLELGGSPDSVQNLWPESYNIPCGARAKDKVENLLHSEICKGSISLEEAQHEIVDNWEEVYTAHYGACN